MTEARRSYVNSLVEQSLGLVSGHLDRYPLPDEFVEEATSVLEGATRADVSRPFLEDRMTIILRDLREAALRDEGCFIRKARWPGGARFGVCLTHDVDNVTRPRSHLWKTRSRFASVDVLRGLLGLVNLYDNIGLIMERERASGFRSSFYFMSSNYPLAKVRAQSDRAVAGGWDVGLHGDFGTHDSVEKMEESLGRFSTGLGFRPNGLREHYLRFDFKTSWKVMEHAGFDYDTTVGTNDRLGFRLGLTSPFHPPSDAWSPMNLLEIPLTLMDTTLWGYLKESESEGMRDAMRLMSEVERVEGLLTLLWHQEAVRMRGGRIYWALLERFKASGCYVASGAQVARWWRSREVPLVREGKLIRLGGEPPKDLVLRLEVRGGATPRIRSGSVGTRGEGHAEISSVGRGFEMEVP